MHHQKRGIVTLTHSRRVRSAYADAEVYLLDGEVAADPVRAIVPEAGIAVPKPRHMGSPGPFRVRILHFNDLHGHFVRIRPSGPEPVFSRIAGAIRVARERARHDLGSAVLVLSAGDDLAGSLFDEALSVPGKHPVPHPGYYLYSAAGVHASVLGNHDLDRGSHALACAIQHYARFPVLSANLIVGPELRGLVHPAALVVAKGVRLGIIGVTTPAQRHGRDGLQVTDPTEAVHNLLPALQPLCDVVIVLSHLGLYQGASSAAVDRAGDVELAQSLSPGSVHLIVGGHTHHALNEYGLQAENIVNGIPIVQAGAMGRFLGQATVTLSGAAALSDARLLHVADLPADSTFEAEVIQPLLTQVGPYLRRTLGPVAGHADLGAEAVQNDLCSAESALANFIADAIVLRCRAAGYAVDLAMIDASVVHDGLPVGTTLTVADWFNVMPYPDTLRLCRLRGRQLAALIQDNACRVDRPEEPHTERGFLHFSQQVRYRIALGPTRWDAQALDIMVGGAPLEDELDREFVVAIPSFLRQLARPWENTVANGPGMPLFAVRALPFIDTGLFMRPETQAHVDAHGGVTAQAGARRDGRLQICRSSQAASLAQPIMRELR